MRLKFPDGDTATGFCDGLATNHDIIASPDPEDRTCVDLLGLDGHPLLSEIHLSAISLGAKTVDAANTPPLVPDATVIAPAPTDISAVFERVQLEDTVKTLRLTVAMLNQALRCAMCAECGEKIESAPWEIDEDERLIHTMCTPDKGAQ